LGRLNRRKDQRTRNIIRNRLKVPIAALLALFSGTVSAVALTQTAVGASALANVMPSAAEPSCAWPVSFNITNSKLLILDSSAAYWDQPIVAGPGVRITISGTYPDASYFSLQTYTPYATPFSVNAVSSSLADYQVAPDQGSTNPWQNRAAPGGRFQVTVRSGVAPGEPNVLPLPSGTSAAHPGYLVYRVYLPAGGSLSHLTPPTVTLAQGSVSRTLPACRTHEPLPVPEKAPPGTTPSPSKASPPAGAFFTPDITTYRGALADANDAYVWTYVIRPAATDVLVVNAKAPTFPTGGGPSPWPAPGEDMQYWSMCIGVGTGTVPTVVNQLPGGRVDYGCRADETTKLNAAGDYNYVIGSEAQRAAISKIPGATFLPFSSTQTTPQGRPWPLYLLLLRNILVSPDFTHSAQKVTQPTDAPAAAAAMGPYYPRVSTCPLLTLTTIGLSACGTH
jgi:hypothetical protein